MWLKIRTIEPFILGILILIRDGFNFRGYDHYGIPAAKALPKFVDFYSGSVGDLILAKIFHTYTRLSWMGLHSTLTLVCVVVIIVLGNNVSPELTRILLLSQIVTLMLQEIGFYDVITILGSVVIAFGIEYRFIVIVGTFVMASGNPQQAWVSSVCILFLCFTTYRYKAMIWNSIFCFLTSSVLLVLNFAWSSGHGRETYLSPEIVKHAIRNFVFAIPYSIISFLGVVIIVLILVWKDLAVISKIGILVSIIIIPSIASAIALDGSRVPICVGAASTIIFLKDNFKSKTFILPPFYYSIMLFFPTLLVWGNGQVLLPWSRLFRVFG
jgi:hypothetical protein